MEMIGDLLITSKELKRSFFLPLRNTIHMAERHLRMELKDIISPDHSVLVVWDVQNMLVNRVFNKDAFISNLEKVIAGARKVKVPVFFTKITPLPERFESSLRLASRRGSTQMSPDMLDLYLKTKEGDIVVNKNTANIFLGTNFEMMIRNAGIETIIFTGISTEIGIESSARDSSNRGFYTVVVEDAVSSPDKEAHERSLLNMAHLFNVRKSSEILEFWK
jgi:nicotinamidase-related amidase